MSAFIPVVDISEHQGEVNFRKMQAAGVAGVILRGGIGGRNDHRCVAYAAAARSAGLPVPLVYWFANPKSSTDAASQGRLCAAAARRVGANRGMIDAEWYDGEGGPKTVVRGLVLAEWYAGLADAVLEETGHEPVIYTSSTYWNDFVATPRPGDDTGALDATLGRLARCPLILARYVDYRVGAPRAGTPDAWDDYAFGRSRGPGMPMGLATRWAGWQFSAGYNGQGATYGVSSRDLDLNLIRPDDWAEWTSDEPGRPSRAQPHPDAGGDEDSGIGGVVRDNLRLALGAVGVEVRAVQIRLNVNGFSVVVDGRWQNETDTMVRRFQAARKLEVDGVIFVGGPTWDALMDSPPRPTVRPGSSGQYVAILQRALNALTGSKLDVDGVYSTSRSSPTGIAICNWQRFFGLVIDGICGNQTWGSVEEIATLRGVALT
jgi:GH25 family lysozyme M1 (1,4-beta-N-acetylmuramidase)